MRELTARVAEALRARDRRGRGSRDASPRGGPGGDSPRGGRGRRPGPRARRRRARSGSRGSRSPRARTGGWRPARPRGWRASAPRSRATSLISSGSACRRSVVGRAYPPGVARRYALREGLALLGGLPLAAWGLASHALPYWLTALVARGSRTSADVTATVKLVAGAVLYPACWALEAWGVWRMLGGWGLAAFLVGLIPTGLFALGWQARLARVRRDARAFVRFLWAPRPARAARGPPPRAGRGDRVAGAAPAAGGAGGRRRPRRPSSGERAAAGSAAPRYPPPRPPDPVSARRASAAPPGASCRTAAGPRRMKCCTPARSRSSI